MPTLTATAYAPLIGYTHVNIGDLADAVENLPGTHGPSPAVATPPPATAALPGELANLATNWDSLPEHVRNAIGALARA